jgi:hypothetical protein
MKVIYNKDQKAYTKIDNAMQFYVGAGTKDLHQTFAVMVHIGERATAPLAFFSEEQKAEECLAKIVDFWVNGDTPTLEINNDTKESVLIVPDAMKSKEGKIINN